MLDGKTSGWNLAQLVEPRTVNPREKSVRVRKREVTLSAGSSPAVPIRYVYRTFMLSVYDDILCQVHSKAVTLDCGIVYDIGRETDMVKGLRYYTFNVEA